MSALKGLEQGHTPLKQVVKMLSERVRTLPQSPPRERRVHVDDVAELIDVGRLVVGHAGVLVDSQNVEERLDTLRAADFLGLRPHVLIQSVCLVTHIE